MKYLLDTNIIIYFLKGSMPALIDRFKSVKCQDIYIPSVVMAELEYGARNSKAYGDSISAIKSFTDNFNKVDLDEASAASYGKIRADLKTKGTIIGANDLMIAANALAGDYILVTHNTGEFDRVNGLRVEDWAE